MTICWIPCSISIVEIRKYLHRLILGSIGGNISFVNCAFARRALDRFLFSNGRTISHWPSLSRLCWIPKLPGLLYSVTYNLKTTWESYIELKFRQWSDFTELTSEGILTYPGDICSLAAWTLDLYEFLKMDWTENLDGLKLLMDPKSWIYFPCVRASSLHPPSRPDRVQKLKCYKATSFLNDQ